MIHAGLRANGLARHVAVPVSAGLLSDVDAYFGALTRYREGDAAEVIRQLAEAALIALANARLLVADLAEIRERWQGAISARRDAAVWRLADLVLRQPVIDIATAQRELGTTPANAHRAIRQLAEAGVLGELTGRRRLQVWQAPQVLAALDDFATRAGRRRLADQA